MRWCGKNLTTFTSQYACGDTKFFALPTTKKLREGMHNSRKKFIYRSPNEGLEEGSYKSKSTLKDGAGRTITFAITYRGRVFYQNWLKGKKKDGNWNASLVKATIPIIRRKIDVSFPSVVGTRIKLLLDNEGAQKPKKTCKFGKIINLTLCFNQRNPPI
jgi:hypothetical protein